MSVYLSCDWYKCVLSEILISGRNFVWMFFVFRRLFYFFCFSLIVLHIHLSNDELRDFINFLLSV